MHGIGGHDTIRASPTGCRPRSRPTCGPSYTKPEHEAHESPSLWHPVARHPPPSGRRVSGSFAGVAVAAAMKRRASAWLRELTLSDGAAPGARPRAMWEGAGKGGEGLSAPPARTVRNFGERMTPCTALCPLWLSWSFIRRSGPRSGSGRGVAGRLQDRGGLVRPVAEPAARHPRHRGRPHGAPATQP